MTFGGGPLNNFVLQAWVKMVERMRSDPGSHGLVTAISGLITKQGVSVLAPEPRQPFVHETVTEAAKASWATIEVERERTGRAKVSSYTVSHARDAASGVALALDFEDAGRTLRVVQDPEWMEAGSREELIGREVDVLGEGEVRWI
jgi:acetyl-CoA C-acetyltransferase